MSNVTLADRPAEKFSNPRLTAKGEERAWVTPRALETLWVNTGTLCNIACTHCYIGSTPTNDALVYFRRDDLTRLLDEAAAENLGLHTVGFTGGEPFMNPDMIAMLEDVLARGHDALVLTNAMRPMQRSRIQSALLRLKEAHGNRLTLRISLDHYTRTVHEAERGADTWAPALEGIAWLRENGFALTIAGRTLSGESEAEVRNGFARLFAEKDIPLDAHDPAALTIFPEMDEDADVPEITTACWNILGKSPEDVMCASARMAVRRKGAGSAAILACTLIAYDEAFELGTTLREAMRPVPLNHPHCARFCVLGGASCSG